MAKIYKEQTWLALSFTAYDPTLSTTVDLTGQTSVLVNVRNPDNSTTQAWTCTVADASNGTFYFDAFSTTSLPTSGVYKLQVQFTIAGEIALGETIDLKVYNTWE